MGQNRDGLALAVLAGHLRHIALGALAFTHEKHGRFGECPLQVRVADAACRETIALSGRLLGARHQPGVGAERLDTGKTGDVLDLIEDHQGQDGADTGHRLQPILGSGIIALSMAGDEILQGLDLLLQAVHHHNVGLDVLAHTGVGEALGDIGPVSLAFQFLVETGQVVLGIGQLDMTLDLRAHPHQVVAPAQQIPGGAHRLGIDIGQGEIPAPDQLGDLLGVDLVILGFPAMDGLHIQSPAENKRDTLLGAKIRQP